MICCPVKCWLRYIYDWCLLLEWDRVLLDNCLCLWVVVHIHHTVLLANCKFLSLINFWVCIWMYSLINMTNCWGSRIILLDLCSCAFLILTMIWWTLCWQGIDFKVDWMVIVIEGGDSIFFMILIDFLGTLFYEKCCFNVLEQILKLFNRCLKSVHSTVPWSQLWY